MMVGSAFGVWRAALQSPEEIRKKIGFDVKVRAGRPLVDILKHGKPASPYTTGDWRVFR